MLAGPAAPANERSVLPALKGLPWWGAVLVAVGATTIGALIDTDSGSSLGRWFKLFYLGGCLLAALAVRQRALFTAAAQPPLVAFIVGVTVLYTANSGNGSLGVRELILKVILPTAYSFPWILLTFLMTLAVVVARWFLVRPKGQALFGKATGRKPAAKAKTASGRSRTRPDAPKPASKSAVKKAAPKTAGAKASRTRQAAAENATARPAKKAARPRTDDARSARVRTDKPQRTARPAANREGRPAARPAARASEGETVRTARPAARSSQRGDERPARPQKRPAPVPRPAPANAAESSRRAAPQTIPARDPRVPRKTAGQLRDTGAIEDLTAGADER
ncbi:hypothetical protein ACH46_14475 [Gordonia phthalatica]|uniref:DUF6542 domain-containing protein n=1 Tax=Gordonia phthalatica TaxID=1136941 RepID=A0A0N9N885_9ACTN|nr:hypothetical protein ACH46_14475 [Gordonia phthalatica]